MEQKFPLGSLNLGRSRASLDSKTLLPNIDFDEELGSFVNQIEQNTFFILSTKQKLTMMKKNSINFESQAEEKIYQFEEKLTDIEKKVSSKFESFHNRIDQMELLAFQPYKFHPIGSISISNAHIITAIYYTPEFIYLGTDTSRILIYNSKNHQFFHEIGPLDENPIQKIGIIYQENEQIFITMTISKMIKIGSPTKPSLNKFFSGNQFCTWPSNFNSQYSLVISYDNSIRLYKKDLITFDEIKIFSTLLGSSQDKLVIVSNRNCIVYNLENQIIEQNKFSFDFNIKLLTVSRQFFCISGDNNLVLCNFDGSYNFININGPTRQLLSYELFYFRISDEMIIEVHDSNNLRPINFIGNKIWSPHGINKYPSVSCIYDATLLTSRDNKCVIWC